MYPHPGNDRMWRASSHPDAGRAGYQRNVRMRIA